MNYGSLYKKPGSNVYEVLLSTLVREAISDALHLAKVKGKEVRINCNDVILAINPNSDPEAIRLEYRRRKSAR